MSNPGYASHRACSAMASFVLCNASRVMSFCGTLHCSIISQLKKRNLLQSSQRKTEDEKATFCPIVFACTGGAGPSAS